MTAWRLLWENRTTRALLAASLALQISGMVVGTVMLSGAGAVSGEAPAGIDLPSLLYVFAYRVFLPQCQLMLSGEALAGALRVSSHLANAGYLLAVIALPLYFRNVLRYREPPVRVFDHPDDKVGRPTFGDQIMPAPALAFPASRQPLYYALGLVAAFALFGFQVRSGNLANRLCSDFPGGASLVPAVQIVACLALQYVILEVVAALWLARST